MNGAAVWASVAAGTVLVLVVVLDVLRTVFHPAGFGGFLTWRSHRLTWRAFTGLSLVARGAGGKRGEERRRSVLAFAAPVMAVLTPALWVVLLVVGFTLIYVPWMARFHIDPGASRGGLLEALYFSGYTATTLGLGDVVPDQPVLRLLTVVEAAAGFGLLTAALGYIMSVYAERAMMTTLALRIAAAVEGVGGDAAFAARLRDPACADQWADWASDVSAGLLRTWQAHTQYPILHFFHSARDTAALPVQLRRVLELRRAVRDPATPAALREAPAVLALCRSVEWYLEAVDRHFLPGDGEPAGGDDQPAGGGDDAEAAHARLIEDAGYPPAT